MGRNTTLKINGNHKYKVNENFEVEIWSIDADEASGPWLRQPGIPSGALFTSVEEAEGWAEDYLNKMQAPIEVSEPTI